jgi:hypothetical protein
LFIAERYHAGTAKKSAIKAGTLRRNKTLSGA